LTGRRKLLSKLYTQVCDFRSQYQHNLATELTEHRLSKAVQKPYPCHHFVHFTIQSNIYHTAGSHYLSVMGEDIKLLPHSWQQHLGGNRGLLFTQGLNRGVALKITVRNSIANDSWAVVNILTTLPQLDKDYTITACLLP
jgi:hypothetical protein